MIEDAKLFKLREAHIRYLYQLTTKKMEAYYHKYGEDYQKILREAESLSVREDAEEYKIINYIRQRSKMMLDEYLKKRGENPIAE